MDDECYLLKIANCGERFKVCPIAILSTDKSVVQITLNYLLEKLNSSDKYYLLKIALTLSITANVLLDHEMYCLWCIYNAYFINSFNMKIRKLCLWYYIVYTISIMNDKNVTICLLFVCNFIYVNLLCFKKDNSYEVVNTADRGIPVYMVTLIGDSQNTRNGLNNARTRSSSKFLYLPNRYICIDMYMYWNVTWSDGTPLCVFKNLLDLMSNIW